MKKNILLIITLTILLFINGCSFFKEQQTLTEVPILSTKEDIKNSISVVDKNTTIIEEKSTSISTEAQRMYDDTVKIQAGLTEENKIKMEGYLTGIKDGSKLIIEDTKEIVKANMSIQEIKKVLESVENDIEITDEVIKKLVKERDSALEAQKKAEEEKNSQLDKMLQYLIVASIIAIGVFAVMFILYGSKSGILGSLGSAVVLVIAIAVKTYITYIAIVGGVILLGLVALLIYNIYIQKKAFKEVVKTVEITQDNLEESVKDRIFGKEDGENGLMKKVQSPSTEKLVRIEKAKIDVLWDYAKNNKKGNLNGGHS